MDRGAARTPTAPSIKLRYLDKDGTEREITSWEALVRVVLGGDLTDETMIQMPGWVRAGHHPGFQSLKERIERARQQSVAADGEAAASTGAVPAFPGRRGGEPTLSSDGAAKADTPGSPVVDFDRLKHAHRPERNPFVDVPPLPEAPAAPVTPDPSPTLAAPGPRLSKATAAEAPPWRAGAAASAVDGGADAAAEEKPIFAPSEIENVETDIRRLGRTIWLFVVLAVAPIVLMAVLLVQEQSVAEALAAHRWALPGIDGASIHWASALDLGLSLAAALVFLVAGHRARNVAEDLLIYGYRWSYMWTVMGLFVPVVNLIRPWLGFGELHRALVNAARIGRIGSHWRRGFSDSALLLALAWIGTVAALVMLHMAYAAEGLTEPRMISLLIMELVARLVFVIVSAGFLAQLYAAARAVLIEIARPRTGFAGAARPPWRPVPPA